MEIQAILIFIVISDQPLKSTAVYGWIRTQRFNPSLYGVFDYLFYMGSNSGIWLPTASHKTWYDYPMRYEFFKFSKIIHDVIAIV